MAPEAPGALVIGADTVVAIDGLILGKPRDAADAAGMLRRLSGRTHQVYTGVALLGGGREECFHECTGVTFAPLTDGEIAWYLSTGNPSTRRAPTAFRATARGSSNGSRGITSP